MSISAGDPLNDALSKAILVVDDEPGVRGLVARWLDDEGYSCAQAGDAREAWEHLQIREVALVTLDIRLPGRSGADLLPDVKAAFPDTAVIMLTGNDETRTAVATLAQGASGYLLKPVERDELVFQVGSALERRRLTLENRQYLRGLERRVREQTAEIRQAHEETIHRLVAASLYRDEETGMHIKRTGLLSELLATATGWPRAEAETIRMAAPMHDVGKIGIPDAILRKPEKLTSEEFDVMKTHTLIGAGMLAGSRSAVLQMAEEIARSHHERWDGGGYPARLTQHAIPESARIVALVDVYDALTHARVYRPAMDEDDALAVIRQGVGTHFDPLLAAAFFSVLPEIRQIAEENPECPAEQAANERADAARCSTSQSLIQQIRCHVEGGTR
jgi:putative two-component system response regulator